MGVIIKEIKIPDEDYSFISDDGEKIDILKNLSKINIFVGENNSGKSRLLRSLISKIKIEIIPNEDDFYNLIKLINEFKPEMDEFIVSNRLSKVSEFRPIYDALGTIKVPNYLISSENYFSQINDLLKAIENLNNYANTSIGYYSYPEWGTQILDIFKSNFEGIFGENKSIEDLKLYYEFKKIYIPILRGLRTINLGIDSNTYNYNDIKDFTPPNNVNSDLYKFRTLLDYFVEEVKEDSSFADNIFTGLNIYDEIRAHKLSLEEEKQELIEEFEEYLSENFFMNEKVKLTPTENEKGIKDDVIMVKIGDERGKPIYNLGDGIQSIIILTLQLFLMKDEIKNNENVLVFIEEPEHLLHPSLQRKLIETFNDERFNKFQFFFTTHSNHFLDISIDYEGISMFTVNKYLDNANNPKFLIKNVDFGDNNILKLLGIRSSSVFLPNCNIWVEGITDILYLRRFFNIYQNHMKNKDMNFKKFDEDRHYSFFVYNGSDITHLLELSLNENDRRLNRLLVIRDGDTEQEEDKKEHNDKLSDKLGNNFELLNCWEMENLLLPSVIIKTLENDKRYRNITLNRTFEEKDYQNEDLKEFIKVNICGNQINWNPVGKKKKFYNKAEKNIINCNHISKDALKLCEKIYNFIKENNS